jgi:hypothetical protein
MHDSDWYYTSATFSLQYSYLKRVYLFMNGAVLHIFREFVLEEEDNCWDGRRCSINIYILHMIVTYRPTRKRMKEVNRLWFSEFWRRVLLQIIINVSEELATSIFISILKMEAGSSSETLVTISNSTRRQNPEDQHLSLPTNSIEQSPSWEADSYSYSPEIPDL